MVNKHCVAPEIFEQVIWSMNILVGRKGVHSYELILNPVARALGGFRVQLHEGLVYPEELMELRHDYA